MAPLVGNNELRRIRGGEKANARRSCKSRVQEWTVQINGVSGSTRKKCYRPLGEVDHPDTVITQYVEDGRICIPFYGDRSRSVERRVDQVTIVRAGVSGTDIPRSVWQIYFFVVVSGKSLFLIQTASFVQFISYSRSNSIP